MSTPRVIPDDVRRVQIEASDPSISAWVSANAGSGKTYVLAQRVIRLLLEGTPPAKILCVSFTKAAAANMANQVFDTLAKWTALDDPALDRAIVDIEGRTPPPARRARARRLFAEALDTPGGLKVQTIHAFCTRLLHQFPFEANVAARFSVLEERAERELLERLRLGVLLQAAGAPESPLGRALSGAIAAAADRTFGTVVEEAIAKRDELTAWLADAGGVAAAVSELSAILGVVDGDGIDRLEAEIAASPILPSSEWPQVAEILASGQKTDRAQADRLRRAAEAAGPARNDAYRSVFLTDTLDPRNQLVTRQIASRHPALAERLSLERDRIVRLTRRMFAIQARDRTAALLNIAAAVIERYRTEKQTRGLLDYNDLIDKTLGLMSSVDAAWVHYKLDLGIDHVLVDEAQDTSPRQWDIIKRLVAEFTVGEGARGDARRSIFAVGDEKQSIFSFQGAAPREFADVRRHFERRHHASGQPFRECRFHFSFRSGRHILSAVDTTFARPDLFSSLTSDADGILHQALPGTLPGLVEIWPLIKADKRQDGEAWDAPFDEARESSPQVRLAERIAATANRFVRAGRRPGEMLVLVRQRGPLFEAVLRALKNAGIAVAGADRLVLTEHIAVMDLLALADALLLPADDLALATALKSPLFGFDDDLLFRLAWRRPGTLRAALGAKAGEDGRFAAAAQRLDRLAELARREPPFAFYARLLGPEGGRKQMLGRLGQEAADALDEFVNLTLAYDAEATPSLQGFVDWMRASATEVKRDMDIARDEVRVMTVHGAKGLEAPIVILADTTTRPAGPRDPRLIPLPAPGARTGAPPRFVWATARNRDVDAMAVAREQVLHAAEAEHRRLLYVGMTRAAEHLIACGAQGLNGKPAGCWYDLVCDALVPSSVEQPASDRQDLAWFWRPGGPPESAAGPAEIGAPTPAGMDEPAPIEIPDWLSRDVPAATGPGAVAPSAAWGRRSRRLAGPSGAGSHPAAQAAAVKWGILVHRLLQGLPDVPAERRVEVARQLLVRGAPEMGEQQRGELAAKVLAVLGDPRFSPLFGAGTRAEVPIVGRIARERRAALLVSGQVDRLAVTAETVLVADYKTDRPAPRSPSDVPEAYVTQLALYRAVLARVYPGRRVRAALVWTDLPQLMELPEDMLDRAMAALLRG